MPIRGQPRYNPRRRSGLGCWLNYQQSGSECAGPTSSIGSSSSSWTNSHYHTFARLMNSGGPPSPCPSDHPFNSASSSLSESSSSHRSQEDDISIVTGNLSTQFKRSPWSSRSQQLVKNNPGYENSKRTQPGRMVKPPPRDAVRWRIKDLLILCLVWRECVRFGVWVSVWLCGLYVL